MKNGGLGLKHVEKSEMTSKNPALRGNVKMTEKKEKWAFHWRVRRSRDSFPERVVPVAGVLRVSSAKDPSHLLHGGGYTQRNDVHGGGDKAVS